MKVLILHSPSVDEGKGLVSRLCSTRHVGKGTYIIYRDPFPATHRAKGPQHA